MKKKTSFIIELLVRFVIIIAVGMSMRMGYNWHKDNFVYLPSVTSCEQSNGITALYTASGDVYVVDVEVK